MKHGLVILSDSSWAQARPHWLAAEEMGFDHAWAYDHLVWGGLPESPWFSATALLGAAAAVTSRIGLGTAVCAPNFRHPYTLYREAQTLDDVSDGRFLLGLGTGGDLDSQILGQPQLTVRERVDRLQEFTDLLLRLRSEDHVDSDGRWFSTRDARTLPAPTRVPLVLAANGPRSIRYAGWAGDAWMTLGPRASSRDEWFTGLAGQTAVLDQALAAAAREPAGFRRFLLLDTPGLNPELPFSLTSADYYEEVTGRAAEAGFTDVLTHWPRAEGLFRGEIRVLEEVAGRLAT